MGWRKAGGLAAYVLVVEAIAFSYATADDLFLGMGVAFLAGVLVAVGIVVQFEVFDVSPESVHSDIVASAVLLASPIGWYAVYGCVFGCPG